MALSPVNLDKAVARRPVAQLKLSRLLASFACLNDLGRAVGQVTLALEDKLSAGALAEVNALAKAAAAKQLEDADKPLPEPPEPLPLP